MIVRPYSQNCEPTKQVEAVLEDFEKRIADSEDKDAVSQVARNYSFI